MRGRWHSMFGITTRLRDKRPVIRGSISCRSQRWPLSLFQNVQTGSGAFPGSYSVGTRKTGQNLKLTTHLHLVSRLRMSGCRAPRLICIHVVNLDSSKFLSAFRKITKSDCWLRHVRLSARQNETTGHIFIKFYF